MSTPMENPLEAKVGDVFRFLDERASANPDSAGASIRLVYINPTEHEPESIAIFAVGTQAVRWTLIAEGVLGRETVTESNVVGYSGPRGDEN